MKPLDEPLVLFANDSFYRAFADRDVSAMNALWATDHPVTCLHPGWPALFGRADVLGSWARILANPQAPKVRAYGARVLVFGAVAQVICYEQLQDSVCVASNGFALEGGEVRLVWHQSGPCQAAPDNLDEPTTWQ